MKITGVWLELVGGLIGGLIGAVAGAVLGRLMAPADGFGDLIGVILGLFLGYALGVGLGMGLVVRRWGSHRRPWLALAGSLAGLALVFLLAEPLRINLFPLLLYGLTGLLAPALALGLLHWRRLA